MSLRFCILTLCGVPLLWADVCQGLPSQGDGSVVFWQYETTDSPPPPVSYRLSVRGGGPTFRITIRVLRPPPDAQSFGGAEMIHAGDIDVARCSDGKRLQRLPFMAWQPLNFGSTFVPQDINFDGYLDLSILTDYASTYYGMSYWVYDPRSEIFVDNALTQELAKNFRGKHLDFDPKSHEMSAGYFKSSCPVNGLQVEQYVGLINRYLVDNNHLTLIHKEEVVEGGPDAIALHCVVRLSDLIDGMWRVTGFQRWRFNAQGEPIGTVRKDGRY